MGLSFAAPLAGRDAISSAITGVYTPFQSTHPLRGATIVPFKDTRSVSISIHAPLAGCDFWCWTANGFITFQSTHPLRGATGNLRLLKIGVKDFNPRTPSGVRPEAKDTLVAAINISIHAPLAGCDQRSPHQPHTSH